MRSTVWENACPDVSVTSLHYYFPWAMTRLLAWSAYCAVSDRPARPHVEPKDWFAVADDPNLSYADKLARYQRMADDYFDKERYLEFKEKSLPDLDSMVLDWVSSTEFDELLTATVITTYPKHEQEQFLAHFRGLLDLWIRDHGDHG